MLKSFTAALALLVAVVPLLLRSAANPAIPALLGALLVLIAGAVTTPEALWALQIVAAAGTIVVALGGMAAVLDAAGFFRWAAFNLAARAQGSGAILFWQIILLSFLTTLFLTNEGSLLIITPLIIEVSRWLGLTPQAQKMYLTAAVLTALATGVASGTSSLGGLLAMTLGGIGPGQYLWLMFVPGLSGVLVCTLVLYLLARPHCLRPLQFVQAAAPPRPPPQPWRRRAVQPEPSATANPVPVALVKDWWLLQRAVLVVAATRLVGPVAEAAGLPIYAVPLVGVVLLAALASARGAFNTRNLLLRVPWPVFGFALGMLVLARGLYSVGLGDWIYAGLANGWLLEAFGLSLAFLAVTITAVPALALAQLTLESAGLTPALVQAGFVAAVLGAGFGGMLNPVGSLAGALWLQQIERLSLKGTWHTYLSVAFLAVPPTLVTVLLVARWWLSVISG